MRELDATLACDHSGRAAADRAESASAPPDRTRIRALLDTHLGFVWRCLRRFGVPASDVDDAAQQVFLIADGKLAHIANGRERSFLFGTALRVASHARRAQRRRHAAQHQLAELAHERSPDPEQLAARGQARALLDRVLQCMDEKQRAVFVLFELEQLSVDEIAALLALPRGTVGSRLRRAREIFHEQAARVQAELRSEGGAP